MHWVKIITVALQILIPVILVGVGIGYVTGSISGDSIVYTSPENFMRAIGVCGADGICDIANVSGCFLCVYVAQLFRIIGDAAYAFWEAMIANIWILLSLGFAIFLFNHTYKEIKKMTAAAAKLEDAKEQKLNFGEWFNPVWKQGVRVLIVGALLGVIGQGGPGVVKAVADVTITPVMHIGSTLAMAASGTINSADCGAAYVEPEREARDVLGPALRPFMCVIGNLNTIVLAGAAGGLALMNYSWMGLGGGFWTWVAGLGLLILFMFIGLNVFFKILTVIFQLVFVIIFLPLIIAAWAYENQWGLLKGGFSNAIGMLAKCAIRIIAITLQILIFYAMVQFAAREAGYTAIFPAGILDDRAGHLTRDEKSASILAVFSECERASIAATGLVDKKEFRNCFELRRIEVERRHPGAFDFMGNGLEFILIMIGLWIVYQYVIAAKIDELLLGGKKNVGSGGVFGYSMGDPFEYGTYVRDFGKASINGANKLLGIIGNTAGKAKK